jgi:hypothetical protein
MGLQMKAIKDSATLVGTAYVETSKAEQLCRELREIVRPIVVAQKAVYLKGDK